MVQYLHFRILEFPLKMGPMGVVVKMPSDVDLFGDGSANGAASKLLVETLKSSRPLATSQVSSEQVSLTPT